jgi:enoyl-CoA hydratase/carnithine racemase
MTTPPGVMVDRIPVDDWGNELAVVTLNKPEAMNPLDWAMARELDATFSELAADAAVRVVAVTGAGRAFSAGGDMKKYATLQRDTSDFPAFLADLHSIFNSISQYSKPYVALVNGIAVAGGLELILACDLAFASSDARIGDAHLVFGQMGGGGVLSLLPRVVGPSRARELLFTGRIMKAEEALAWGLVTQVVEPDGLLQAAIEFTQEVSKKSALALANAKQVMNSAWRGNISVDDAMRLEREVTARYCLTSVDAPEGLAAFAEKREPEYLGR